MGEKRGIIIKTTDIGKHVVSQPVDAAADAYHFKCARNITTTEDTMCMYHVTKILWWTIVKLVRYHYGNIIETIHKKTSILSIYRSIFPIGKYQKIKVAIITTCELELARTWYIEKVIVCIRICTLIQQQRERKLEINIMLTFGFNS